MGEITNPTLRDVGGRERRRIASSHFFFFLIGVCIRYIHKRRTIALSLREATPKRPSHQPSVQTAARARRQGQSPLSSHDRRSFQLSVSRIDGMRFLFLPSPSSRYLSHSAIRNPSLPDEREGYAEKLSSHHELKQAPVGVVKRWN